ncbi:LysM peptidoglycan-binding domain-containing protein [Brevibacterium atlanticum]|uniref:LysM peptidoglycan-binding domain-containing protein n=1 Tax=Brevibacterium atlanticum TaxID=2697563 RepID=UPI0014227A8C|nr:LysM domain-containing protein [Brevibacterium atlanticum]
MYRLIACAVCWLVLLGSFVTAWDRIPRPWTATDLVVLAVIGATAVAFARLGLVSVAALLLRILPSGRIRTLLAGVVVHAMPRLLTSSVLAVASTAVVVQAADAAPGVSMSFVDSPHPTGAEAVATSPVDPGWPTIGDSPSSPNSPDSSSQRPADESADDGLHDPGWPDDSPEQAREHVHEVDDGESLWSIAEGIADDATDVPELVQDIYTANRDTIGPDPSLIIAGQRLEIQQ